MCITIIQPHWLKIVKKKALELLPAEAAFDELRGKLVEKMQQLAKAVKYAPKLHLKVSIFFKFKNFLLDTQLWTT